jgi:hypothetical protein
MNPMDLVDPILKLQSQGHFVIEGHIGLLEILLDLSLLDEQHVALLLQVGNILKELGMSIAFSHLDCL